MNIADRLDPDLRDVTVAVRRRTNDDGSISSRVEFTMAVARMPRNVRLLGYSYPLTPVISPPRTFFTCQRFRHISYQCHNSWPICEFCFEHHRTDSFPNKLRSAFCSNYCGNHVVSSRECSVYQYEFEINKFCYWNCCGTVLSNTFIGCVFPLLWCSPILCMLFIIFAMGSIHLVHLHVHLTSAIFYLMQEQDCAVGSAWIPSHSGIVGNEQADYVARLASRLPFIVHCGIPLADLFSALDQDYRTWCRALWPYAGSLPSRSDYFNRVSFKTPIPWFTGHRPPRGQFRSDWSMRETIVSGVSSAPTACPRASLATAHFAQTKSACSALSTGKSQ